METVASGGIHAPVGRKRLGQFFTRPTLARLLAELADARTATSICDPMVGQGDMLLAAVQSGASQARLTGVDIDPVAYEACVEFVRETCQTASCSLKNSDAFDPTTWLDAAEGYDLIITNPPFVRYQSLSNAHDSVPDADAVRNGLKQVVQLMTHLPAEDRTELSRLVDGYSGHADLLLPAWLLCTALVRVGGTLATVVPESFLSRNYGSLAWYTLLRWFDLKFIVQDADAAWFGDAQVRTALIVAKRVERKSNPLSPDGVEGHLLARLRAGAADTRSLVGGLSHSDNPDRDFALAAQGWLSTRSEMKSDVLEAHWVPADHMADLLFAVAGNTKWLRRSVPDVVVRERGAALPIAMSRLFSAFDCEPGVLVTPQALGWSVGQGLRTGANDFFYLHSHGVDHGLERVSAPGILGDRTLQVPSRYVLPVLRRHSELGESRVLDARKLQGRLLLIESDALPEDRESLLDRYGAEASAAMAHIGELPPDLVDLVRAASATYIGSGTSKRLLPSASAVSTNVRHWSPDDPSAAPRFWYMLPALRDRHRPALVLPRVQGAVGGAFLNPGRNLVVDANFSGFWPGPGALLSEYAMLSLLNSTWVAAHLEVSSSVMGGGALKVEATHLGRLCLPSMAFDELHSLGMELADATSASQVRRVVERIDNEIAHRLVGANHTSEFRGSVAGLMAERRAERMTGVAVTI